MSSLRNSIKRREHKERSQPAERNRYGLLEKHKDYVIRARNYHQKENTIRILREKAANRNPDEFYFKMINSKTKDGVHVKNHDTPKYSNEEMLLLKTQDIGYLLTKVQSEAKKIERLESCLHLLDSNANEINKNKHLRFADDIEEANEMEEKLNSKKHGTIMKPLPKTVEKKKMAAYEELSERKKRMKSMKKVIDELSIKKQLMKKKVKVRKIHQKNGPAVYKWKKERSK